MAVLELKPLNCSFSVLSFFIQRADKQTSSQPEYDPDLLLAAHAHLWLQMKFDDKHDTLLTKYVLVFMIPCGAAEGAKLHQDLRSLYHICHGGLLTSMVSSLVQVEGFCQLCWPGCTACEDMSQASVNWFD